MNKLKTLVASVVVAALSFGTANSIELRAGLTGQSTAYYATVKEQLKDKGKVSQDEAVAAFSYMSVFGEVAFDSAMGISIGLEYSPDTITFNSADRVIVESTTNTAEGDNAAAPNDSGTQVIGARVKELTLLYLGIPLLDSGLTLKAGYHMSTLQTTETLATGSTYKDEDLDGYSVGLYYDGAISDNLFYRVEGSYQQFEDINLIGTEVGGTALSFNKLTAELGGVAAKASIGFKF